MVRCRSRCISRPAAPCRSRSTRACRWCSIARRTQSARRHPVRQQRLLTAAAPAGRSGRGRTARQAAGRMSLSDRLTQRRPRLGAAEHARRGAPRPPATPTRSPRSSAPCTRRCSRSSAPSSMTRTSTSRPRAAGSADAAGGAQREETPLTAADRTRIAQEIADDILGYGPLEPFLRDPDVTEIMVNGSRPDLRRARRPAVPVAACVCDECHLRRTIDKIVAQVGRRVDESSPMVDARLPDGSRVNAIIPPLALDGSCSRSASSPPTRSRSTT